MNPEGSSNRFWSEPYRLFFLIGLGYLLIGLAVWILFEAGWILYPVQLHPHAMIEGFLLNFAVGFLMTAIPRFTRSHPATRGETATSAVVGMLAGWFPYFALAAMLLLIRFGLKRNIASSRVPKPSFFVFIQGGLLLGLMGVGVQCFSPESFPHYKIWLYEGMMMLWLCGIGSRILTMLLSASTPPLPRKLEFATFLALFGSYLVQPFAPSFFWIELIRSLAISFLALRVWKAHRPPVGKGALAWSVWTGIVFLVAGQWTKTFFPSYTIHALHLIFIGAFGLLALMVSVRVSIAHAGEPLESETRYRRIRYAAILIALAAVTRFSAGFLPEVYDHHLVYAAVTFLVAIPLWASVVIPHLNRFPR